MRSDKNGKNANKNQGFSLYCLNGIMRPSGTHRLKFNKQEASVYWKNAKKLPWQKTKGAPRARLEIEYCLHLSDRRPSAPPPRLYTRILHAFSQPRTGGKSGQLTLRSTERPRPRVRRRMFCKFGARMAPLLFLRRHRETLTHIRLCTAKAGPRVPIHRFWRPDMRLWPP
jgi:hypothetical protein